ncbi:MAG: SPOR domain-containing protein [Bdellovibrionaceae bacterium]|nr:SPOR domain-containing protein [Pseudobdellovibrionaceae bacterium]
MYKLNQKGASSWDLVLKILSITLVSLFAFSSGVWFGKKLSDSDYQRLALEGEFDREVGKGQTASKESDPTDDAAHDAEALTEEEVAAATDKAIHGQKAADASEHESAATGHGAEPAKPAQVAGGHGAATEKHEAAAPAHAPEKARSVASTAPAASAHSAAPANSGKPDLSAAHQAAARVASNAAPVAKEQPKAESRVPSSLPKTVGATNDVEFTVQVASYPTAEAAKEHVDSLVKKGFPAFPVEASINGKVWYRVSVGSFKSFNDASKYRAQLVKQTDLPSAIVSKISR